MDIGGQRDVNRCKPCKQVFTRKSDIHRLNQELECGARNKLVKVSCVVHGARCKNSSESPRFWGLHMDGKS